LLIRHLLELLAGEGLVGTLGDPEVAGDRQRSDGLVAGHHVHLDPRSLARLDRVLRPGSERVDHSDQAKEAQPLGLRW
jgi:hypothetical protein